MKISHYIFVGFLFILLLFSLTTYINFNQSEEVKANAEYVSRSSSIVQNATRFQRNVLNMVSGLRGYLLTGEHAFIQAYDSTANENAQIIADLSRLVETGSRQQKILTEIRLLNNEWINEIAEPLKEAKRKAKLSDSSLAAYNQLYREKLTVGEEKSLNQRFQERLRQFINEEYQSREVRKLRLAKSIERTRMISFSLTSLSIIIGFVVAGILAYSISRRITKMVNMADNIAHGNYEVHMQDTGRDELSKLAHSLNHMASVLSENISLLKRKNEELDQFAHVVSHDMKGPLRGIDNVISWIEEDHATEISPKVHQYLQMIKGRVVRGENLIQGILSYARVGRDIKEKEPVDVTALVYEVAETVAIRPGITLMVEPNMPVLHTHKFPLLQVFSNLISNAVKYHDKEEGLIRVYHKAFPGYYIFFVADDGPGIAAHYHDKIFVIFQTLQERDSFESNGVGLAIIKKILDGRKERINLESAPGKGAIFSFTWSKI